MAKENKIYTPGVFGGLMRYDEEYESRFMLSPAQVVAFVVALGAGVVLMKFLFG
ncbi:preprotein translocase subunit Sec61beta [Candidatus Pacearchaeota archaeon]|nr:MAG: preprotein translocase subunit Sec61beta [Candidatus Pacearchaeota archaeon]